MKMKSQSNAMQGPEQRQFENEYWRVVFNMYAETLARARTSPGTLRP